jgi:predicted O-methyltransferase YrrM
MKNKPIDDSFLTSGAPWLTEGAIEFLDRYLKRTHKVLEMGTGGSTIFFSKRVHSVFSIEHDEDWHNCVHAELRKQNIHNVTGVLLQQHSTLQKAYIRMLEREKDCSAVYDVILIDGRERSTCIKHSIDLLKPEGLLILDNYDRPQYQHAISKYLTPWGLALIFNAAEGVKWSGKGTKIYVKP